MQNALESEDVAVSRASDTKPQRQQDSEENTNEPSHEEKILELIQKRDLHVIAVVYAVSVVIGRGCAKIASIVCNRLLLALLFSKQVKADVAKATHTTKSNIDIERMTAEMKTKNKQTKELVADSRKNYHLPTY